MFRDTRATCASQNYLVISIEPTEGITRSSTQACRRQNDKHAALDRCPIRY